MLIELLPHMLADRGIKVSKGKLSRFLIFVQEQCPWFPEEGTINLETWTMVGDQLHLFYTLHGPEKVPVDAFALWNMIRDVLDSRNEAVRQSMGKATAVDSGSLPSAQIMFSVIDKKRKETVLCLPRKERACRTLRPGALASPLPLYANL